MLSGAMRIMVRTLRGDWVALDVDGATTTVAQVKGMVMARERIAVAMQRLFFAGRCLDDDHSTLADYGVRHDSVVFLSLRLATDAYQKEMWLMQPETTTTKKEMHQQQLLHVHVAAADEEKARSCHGCGLTRGRASTTPGGRRQWRDGRRGLMTPAWGREREKEERGRRRVGPTCMFLILMPPKRQSTVDKVTTAM